MNAVPLAGKHALITGAGRGIGAAIAAELATRGAHLTLVGRNQIRLDEQIAALGSESKAHAAIADVTDERAVRDAFALARERFGPIAILVNNAGIARSSPLAKTDRSLWDEVIAINLTGTFLCAREAAPDMIAARFGRIVNVASTAGLVGGPYISAYCASKHGVVGLTKALAAELVRYGITVNAVCPGFTESEMLQGAVQNIARLTGRSEESARATLAATNAMNRFVLPEEVAATVAWLASPEAEAINGQAIVIAGGEARSA